MPPEGVLPVCPRAVATARPGREAWALEELLDAVAPSPGTSVVETGHRGVYAVLSELDPCRLAGMLMGWEYSFVKTIVVADRCTPCSEPGGLLEEVARSCPSRARFMFRLRGPCKDAADPRSVAAAAGIVEVRGSRLVFSVEGVGGWLLATCGRLVERPYGALLVVPAGCTG